MEINIQFGGKLFDKVEKAEEKTFTALMIFIILSVAMWN